MWLHPMIQEEAIARLRASEDWEKANQSSRVLDGYVKIIKTITTGINSFEAYHHCQQSRFLILVLNLFFYDYSSKNSLIDFETWNTILG
jgi:hypothetical protein